jgi:Cu/Ag efflux protein CusF
MRRIFQVIIFAFLCFLLGSLSELHWGIQAQERRYHLDGTIVSIDEAQKRVVVKHGEIPGFMAAMTMGYSVLDVQVLGGLTPGDQITADVVVMNGGIHLESVVVVKKSDGTQMQKAEPDLHDAKMLLPKDFRQWVFLTSGFAMTYDPNAGAAENPRFDNVFVNPDAYQSYLQTGTWPNKTVLVLESRASESKLSINKNGRVQTGVTGIDVHVKDLEHGGWAFYAFDHGAEQGTLLPKSEGCYSCHEQNGAVDTTFVQFYPTLIDVAKSKGSYRTTRTTPQ